MSRTHRLNTIKAKYIITGITICLLSVLLVSITSYIVSYNIASDLSDKRIYEITLRKAAEFDYWFDTQQTIIDSFSQDIAAAGDFSRPNLTRLMATKMTIFGKEYSDVYFGYSDRKLVLVSGVGWVPEADYDATTRPWFTDAAKSDSVIFTEPYVDAWTGNLVITVAKAIRKDGRFVGVLAADIFITDLIKVVNSVNIGERSYAMLLDGQGSIISHPSKDFLPTEKGFKTAGEIGWKEYGKFVSALETAKPGEKISLRDYNGEKSFFVFSRTQTNNWNFIIAISRAEYQKPLSILFLGFGLAFFISILIGLVVMYKMVDSMIRPVKSLTNTVRNFSAENMAVRAEVVSDDEIGILAKAFNAMAETIGEHNRTLEAKVASRTLELKETNDHLMESIGYARRLQNAIIPNLQQKLGLGADKCFSIWRPRDTVGGDMFWCRTDGSKKLLVVADCTGHGVPGALMSMTLSSILDAAARETGFASPAKTMELANRRLKQNLMENNDDTQILDGADVAMLMIDTDERKLIFAGAGLSLFTVDGGKVTEHKGNKNGIGFSFGKTNGYADQEIPFVGGGGYYFTTDGFTDQNSEAHQVGIGKKGFIAILEKEAGRPMQEQKAAFEREIEARLAKVSQRDDITVIGFAL